MVAEGKLLVAEIDAHSVHAFDARTGENLWHFQTGSSIWAAPITYMVERTQYVMIPSGTTLFAFALPEE